MSVREIKGRHVLAGFSGAFGLIIAVNLVLAWNAVRTFPGLEVGNSYVASQQFDDRRAAQEALGWQVAAGHADGLLRLVIVDRTGVPVRAASLEATVGRATHMRDDRIPEFRFDGAAYLAPMELGEGNWNIRMRALADDGTEFTQRLVLFTQ